MVVCLPSSKVRSGKIECKTAHARVLINRRAILRTTRLNYAVDARTIPLQQLEPAPLEASDGCISRCHAIVRLYQEGGSYVADLLDVRNPERTDSNRATIRPLGNAGRGPPLAPGT